MSHNHSDGTTCPNCQRSDTLRRQREDDADEKASRRFRMMVLAYLVYPIIVLSLLSVIAAGAYLYVMKGVEDVVADNGPEPVWCASSSVGALPSYAPVAHPQAQGGYEPAVPSAASSPIPTISPTITLPNVFGESVQAAASIGTDRIAYYVTESIKAADGAPDARYRRDMVSLNQVEISTARQRFIERSRLDGKLGFYRLGVAQLGADVYTIAARRGLTVPFCRPNDFVTPDKTQAYFNFAVAKACDTQRATRAQDWLLAIAQNESFPAEQAVSIELDARNFVAGQPLVCATQLVADAAGQTGPNYYDDSDDTEMPAAPPPPPGPQDAAKQQGNDQINDQLIANYARQLLNLGDAALAEGRLGRARRWWLRAIEAGKTVGAQAAITAQKRIQTHTLTCHFTDESLKAISRDYKARSGDLIHPRVIQQALRALGHYDGPVNGNLGVMTRAAIRKFQREMEFDETETLTPLQTVYVICNAAETARDLASQNALGIMYAAGLGVDQNIDLALEWLRAASSRRYADATYNLALLYGSGIALGSYRLCDIPQSPEQADQYLREAAHQGHGRAIALLDRYGGKSVRERWRLIETEELAKSASDKNGIYAKRLATIGAKCEPERVVR